MAKTAPVTDKQKLYELLEASRLLAPDKLAAAAPLLERAADATALARSLIQQGLLTKWQALQLLNGFNQLVVSKYKLLDQTGATEWARTYLAEHAQMNKKCELRMLSRRLASQPEVVSKFVSDAQTAAQLDHRNLVHVFDVASDGERQHYIVTEQVAGQPLSALGAKAASLPVAARVSYIWQACEGLAHAHEAGVSHGDLKPENLVVDGEGTLKILNLGVSNLNASQAGAISEATEMIGPDQHRYMAPERLGGESADAAADIYSLGGVFGYLLTGAAPPSAIERKEGSACTTEEIQKRRADCPAALAALCEKMTALEAANRPTSFAEVVGVLKAWAQTAKTNGAKRAAARPAATKEAKEPALAGINATTDEGAGAAVKAKRVVKAKALPASEPAQREEPAFDEIRINVGEDKPAEDKPAEDGPGAIVIDTGPKKAAKKSPAKADAAAEKNQPEAAPAAEETPESAEAKKPAPKRGGRKKGVPVWMLALSIVAGVLILAGGAFAVYIGANPRNTPVVAKNPEQPDAMLAAATQPGDSTKVEESNPVESNPVVEPAPPMAVPTTDPPAATKPENPPADPSSAPPSTEATPKPVEASPPEVKPEPVKPEPVKPVKPAPPAKPADPFPGTGARVVVDLPTLPAKGSTEVPPIFKVAPCTAPPDAILTVNLRGGDSVLRSKQNFTLEEADQGKAKQAWDCKLNGVEGNPIVATLKVDEGELRFLWTAAAVEHPLASSLRNCVLAFSAPGRDKPLEIFLRSPVKVEPFVLDPSKPTISFKANLEAPPLEERYLTIQFGKVEGAAHSAFRPSPNLDLAKEVTKPLKGKEKGGLGPVEPKDPYLWVGKAPADDALVLGFKLDPNLSARMFQISAVPFYRVEAAPAPIKLNKKLLPQAVKSAEGNLLAANAREKQADAMPNGEPKNQAKNSAKADIRLAEKLRDQVTDVSTLVESMTDGVKVHFVLIFQADGIRVPLLIAGDAPPQ